MSYQQHADNSNNMMLIFWSNSSRALRMNMADVCSQSLRKERLSLSCRRFSAHLTLINAKKVLVLLSVSFAMEPPQEHLLHSIDIINELLHLSTHRKLPQ